MRIKGRENKKVNNSTIIPGKGTAEVQCNGQWLCPPEQHHMDVLDRYERQLMGIEFFPATSAVDQEQRCIIHGYTIL